MQFKLYKREAQYKRNDIIKKIFFCAYKNCFLIMSAHGRHTLTDEAVESEKAFEFSKTVLKANRGFAYIIYYFSLVALFS